MLQELRHLHQELMAAADANIKRFLYSKIAWDSRAICIYGARGVGKTTLLCQFLLKKYGMTARALYISADNIHVLSGGLLNLATEFFAMGGEALFIDEVHKYPNWTVEVKNIIDSFPKKQIILSGSSAMELQKGKGDLSRRVVYYELPGLSFREYLIFTAVKELQPVSLDEVLTNSTSVTQQLAGIAILKHFQDYLRYGYYPYFLEDQRVYFSKLNNVIEKVITEDITASKQIKATTTVVLKKLLWLIATAKCLVPNIDNISRDLKVTRQIIYSSFGYLEKAGLINNIYPDATGMKLIRKPGKSYLDNSNLLYAISGTLAFEGDIGSVRETFFANQVSVNHVVTTHEQADFTVDHTHVLEVGGRNKKEHQLKGLSDAYLAIDGIQVGVGRRIPLYLFGFLY